MGSREPQLNHQILPQRPREDARLSQAVLHTDADVLLPIIDQPLVHLITDAQDIMLHTQVCNEFQLPSAEYLQQAGNGGRMQQEHF